MEENHNNLKRIIKACAATCIITVAATVLVIGKFNGGYKRLMRAQKIIKESYIGDFNPEKAEDEAIRALLLSTNDKYASYYTESEAGEVFEIINGYYVGVGLEIFANTEKDRIEVASVYNDGPSFKSGIKQGDLILKIDDTLYTAEDVNKASAYMRGDKDKNVEGTQVRLTVLRNGEELDFTVKRERIDLYKVEYEITKENIGVVKYKGFTQTSEKNLKKAIDDLIKKNVKGLVIDVRANPGGDFDSAIRVTDMFLDSGTIMYTLDKKDNKTVYTAEKGSYGIPLALLVDSSSASATEIFAGSLKDNKRAVIVGEKTYGKGVSQAVININSVDEKDGVIKITTLKNYTPNGRWINEKIIPDYEIKDDETTTADEALEKAIEILLKD